MTAAPTHMAPSSPCPPHGKTGIASVEQSRPAKRTRLRSVVDATVFDKSRPSCINVDGDRQSPAAVPETYAIAMLAEVWSNQKHSKEGHIIWKLDNFSIYQPSTSVRYASELTALHLLNSRDASELAFDGVLSTGCCKVYVQDVPFSMMAIDGYGSDEEICSPQDKTPPLVTVCIQSKNAARNRVWYQLGTPASKYECHYSIFLWVAHLGKNVVDFLFHAEETDQSIGLDAFRHRFFHFLSERYVGSLALKTWSDQSASRDFRQAVNAHVQYLWTECYNLPGEDRPLSHPLWDETLHLNAIPQVPNKLVETAVTPFVGDCFRNMPFHAHLAVPPLDPAVQDLRRTRRQQLNLTPIDCRPTNSPLTTPGLSRPIRRGDVTILSANKNSKWHVDGSTYWYAYVQDVRTIACETRLDLI